MKRAQHGMSLVELMIGVAVGLFIVATASFAMSNQLADHRRLMLDTQLEQDLRAAADLIVRDLRRSGYWQNAAVQLASPGVANPYAEVASPAAAQPGNRIGYAYSQDAAGHEDDSVGSTEQAGIKLEDGTLKLLLGDGGWQAITDPGTITVTAFRVGLDTQSIDLADYCANPCPAAGTSPCPPLQQVRAAHIEIEATSASDRRVARSLRSDVRLRNDRIVGHCAA